MVNSIFTTEAKNNIDTHYEILRILKHPIRQKMLEFILTPKNVTEILVHCRLEQSEVSRHLLLLKKHNFVINKKEGIYNLYTITSRVEHVLNSL